MDGSPICVTGMHRTGTSLVAGLLHRHGLWLGEEADMMPANPYNPEGYFGNDRIVELDDAVLATFDGSWSSPPALTGEWTQDARLADLKAAARALGSRLGEGHATWGFKDPRAALTLPFWRSVWGELTVVVTLRNPLETARSINRRDGMQLEQAVALWKAHYRSILNLTTPATRIVVAYEAMCVDPMGSTRALLSRVPGLVPFDAPSSGDTVRPSLWHFRDTVADLESRGVERDVLELYAELRAEAINPEPELDEQLAESLRALPAALAGLDLAIRDLHLDVQRLAAVVSRLDAELATATSPKPTLEVLGNGRRD